MEKKAVARSVFEWVEAMLTAIIVVVIICSFVFRIVAVTGHSMENTLHDQDRIIVTNFNYKPKTGDIVVVSHGQHLKDPLVKRVIATEGQTLRIDFNTGEVYVDGVLLDESAYIKNPTTTPGDMEIPSVIPEGYVFVMGDNRQISLDSRYVDVGLIDVRNIMGKAQWIIFPFNRIGDIN